MVLIFNGVKQNTYPKNTKLFSEENPHYSRIADEFSSKPTETVDAPGLLYVSQKEMAIVSSNDKNVKIIGSDAATTCIIVILRHSISGAVALAHLDGDGMDDAITKMITKIQELSSTYPKGNIELQLVGGYSDEKQTSENIFCKIMKSFHANCADIHLKMACVGDLNTIHKSNIKYPKVYGVGVIIKTGEIFPATFTDMGPDECLRNARLYAGVSNVLDIYDSEIGQLHIDPFHYKITNNLNFLLQKSDKFLLNHFSTSPDVEPPNFVNHLKSTFKFMLENPCPSLTIFIDNRPRCYRRDENTGYWKLVS